LAIGAANVVKFPTMMFEDRLDRFPATDYSNYFQRPRAPDPAAAQADPVASSSWDARSQEYVFRLEPVARPRTVRLPIYYLPENELLVDGVSRSADGNELVREAFPKSYSLVAVPAGTREIRVKLNGRNRWKWASLAVLGILLANLFLQLARWALSLGVDLFSGRLPPIRVAEPYAQRRT
jgi:hypothetical protein